MNHVFCVEDVVAAEILDSRGSPTVACELRLTDGSIGFMQVPSGASTGQYEAVEVRDGDKQRFWGKGTRQVVWNIEAYIKPRLINQTFASLAELDAYLCTLDGTAQKANLGANALLAVSGAFARAAAQACKQPLYHLLHHKACELPVPMMNVINGGRHADNDLAIQEFMIVPHGVSTFSEAVHAGAEITRYLGEILQKRYGHAGRGDEGGFAPSIRDPKEALDAIMQAISQSSYSCDQVGIALDLAASEYANEHGYFTDKSGVECLNSTDWIAHIQALVAHYPIVSLEDIASDTDHETWARFTASMRGRVQIVGDDVFVTQSERLQAGIAAGIGNAILLKPNQVGTLNETITTTQQAKQHGYATVMSHRSGETEDAMIADLAVGLSCQQIKTGPLRQSDRVAKYNRLLWIEKTLGREASYASHVYQRYRIKQTEEVAVC